MKKLLLFPIGLIPLIFGFGMNYLITDMNVFGIRLTLISLLFILIWFFIAFALAGTKIDSSSLICYSLAIGIINYIFIVIQLVIFDRWFGNLLGIASQFYILPTLSLVNLMDVLNVFNKPLGYTSCAMAIIFLVYYVGVTFRRRTV